MKVRIFALAKELGLDSKKLIDLASEAGVIVKNSALASISPEERDIIVAHIENRGGTEIAEPEVVAVPTRDEAAEESMKVRTLPQMPSRPQPQAKAEPPVEEVPEAPAEPVTEETPVPEQEEATPVEGVPAVPTEPVAEEPETPEPPSEESPPKPEEPKPESKIGFSRDDYIPTGGSGSVREMRPQGNLGSGSDRRANKPKPQIAMPNLAAAPSFEAPKAKQEKRKEPAAQKPEMKLTPDLLGGGSPLAEQILQKEQRDLDAKTGKGGRKGGKGARDQRGPGEGDSEFNKRSRARRLRDQQDDQRNEGRQNRRPFRTKRGPKREVVHKTSAVVETPITVRSFSEDLGRPAKDVMKVLMTNGKMAKINDTLEEEDALEVALELGVDIEIKRPKTAEDILLEKLEQEDAAGNLAPRPPVVTILGHVDHGKTSLLDKIRSANVTEGEAGGITQHIASYQVTHNDHPVTFVDTPGHAAFGEMRARGANVTDIIVLVVAADDGVMPQTVECISHAKSTGAPIIVAMNKCDLPDADQQKVLQDLAANEILPSEWGGDVEVIRTSAMTGEGIPDLLETILLTAELHEYQENPDRNAVGVCLEAFRDEGRGVLSWMIVQKGTLKVGDPILCGSTYGRVRAMYNDRNQELIKAGPSTPVMVAGLTEVPSAGDHFFGMNEIDEAREIAEDRKHRDHEERMSSLGSGPVTLEDILEKARGGGATDLPLILKADAPGSIEAIRSELGKLEHPEVRVQIIHEGVGGVNESDVYLASAAGAIIVAFHVIAEDRAAALADAEGVDIRRFRIIYELTDTIKRVLEGLLQPEEKEVATGRALVLRAFSFSKVGKIAGCRILNGTIERNNRIHVIRDQTVLNNYPIASLRREKDDVKEVREGMECGIRLDGFNDVKEGDLLEAYRIESVKRTLD